MLSADIIHRLETHLHADGSPESQALLDELKAEVRRDEQLRNFEHQVLNAALNLLAQLAHPRADVGDALRQLLNTDSWSCPPPSQDLVSTDGIAQKGIEAFKAFQDHRFDAAIDAFGAMVEIFRLLWEADRIVEARNGVIALLEMFRNIPQNVVEVLSQQLADSGRACALQTFPERSHLRRISCFTMSNGAYNHFVNRIVRRKRPAELDKAETGVLNLTAPRQQIDFKRSMNFTGYHLFDSKLSDSCCESLKHVAHRVKGRPTGPEFDSSKLTALASLQGKPDGFWYDSNELINQPEIQDLLADPSFEHAARLYLGAEPYLVGVNMWWSFPNDASSVRRSEMAQHFHFDADFNHFINFFIHLTDTDVDSGAHVFIAGSHRPGSKPQEILNRGYVRISDQELAQHHDPQSFTMASVEAGSILAGDTRCWHRGSHPNTKARLMLEFIYADTLATSSGKGMYPLDKNVVPAFQRRIETSPEIYRCQTLRW